jgi:hypothetical protein
MAVHLVVQPLDLGDLGIRDARARKPPGGGFQSGQNLEAFADVLRREAAYASAPIREQLDQPLRREDL